jgi:hypothetical protein
MRILLLIGFLSCSVFNAFGDETQGETQVVVGEPGALGFRMVIVIRSPTLGPVMVFQKQEFVQVGFAIPKGIVQRRCQRATLQHRVGFIIWSKAAEHTVIEFRMFSGSSARGSTTARRCAKRVSLRCRPVCQPIGSHTFHLDFLMSLWRPVKFLVSKYQY